MKITDFSIAGTASATGTINDNDAAPTVATITPASATEGSPAVFEFSLSNRLLWTYTVHNGTAGSADYTTNVTVTVPAGATTGNGSVTTDTVLRKWRRLCIASGTASAGEQSMIMMRLQL
jgi:hypothetical protein